MKPVSQEKVERQKRFCHRLAADMIAAAIAQCEAYDRWLIESEKDIGESLAAYGAKTDACLKATKVYMRQEKKLAAMGGKS